MSRICPHFNYFRKSDGIAPDWQCPSCEKAYIRVGSSLLLNSRYQPARSPVLRNRLV
ncbi:MAG: hypothetical protein KGP14_02100 [Betaproteobacteria bacterium]|nr:hypothetical protein [Betaproteobacteria bacterium]